MRIGIDVDGVLGGLHEAVLPILNQYLGGTNYTLEDWTSWHFMNEKLSTTILMEAMDQVWMQGLVMPLEAGLRQKVKALSKHGKITIITKRTHLSHPAVIQRLQDWGVKYHNIIFLGSGEQKLDYPIDVLIDDHPDIEYHQDKHPEKIVLVRDQPWSPLVTKYMSNVYFVYDLAHAKTVLDDLKEG